MRFEHNDLHRLPKTLCEMVQIYGITIATQAHSVIDDFVQFVTSPIKYPILFTFYILCSVIFDHWDLILICMFFSSLKGFTFVRFFHVAGENVMN